MFWRRKPLVLVVEDDPSLRDIFLDHLRADGIPAIGADSGPAAIQAARERKPALVVLDIMLPEIHGIDVCHRIKSDPALARTKVLIVSVKSFPADRKQAEEAGADGFLSKPVGRSEFLETVRQYLK